MRVLPLAVATLSTCLALAACGSTGVQPDPDAGPEAFATIHELMAEVVAPQAELLWTANAIVSDETGIHSLGPKTDEDWDHLRSAAVIMGEAQNMLVVPGRKIMPEGEAIEGATLTEAQITQRIVDNNTDFRANARAMQSLAREELAAIDARDLTKMEDIGSRMDEVCEQCHLQFYYPPATPAN